MGILTMPQTQIGALRDGYGGVFLLWHYYINLQYKHLTLQNRIPLEEV